MNIQEMHIGVGLGIQKVNSNAFDSFIDEEIDYYLNKAQREYVRRQNVFLKENVENLSRPDKIATLEAAENLGGLINFSTLSEIDESEISDNSVDVDISNLNMFQYIYATAQLNDANGKWVSCKLISPHEIHIYSQAEYNDPLFRRLPLLITKDKFVIFYDTNTTYIHELNLLYIKKPETLSLVSETPVNSDLPEHTHDEIVDLAVNMILGDLKVAGPAQHEQQSIPKER
jgi:hypothetical protein